jgi:hypothetical protein
LLLFLYQIPYKTHRSDFWHLASGIWYLASDL